jgi:hypothetical protein
VTLFRFHPYVISPWTKPQVAAKDDESDFGNVDFVSLARLVKAGLVTETKLFETAFELKAGSSKRYIAARATLKHALDEVRDVPA